MTNSNGIAEQFTSFTVTKLLWVGIGMFTTYSILNALSLLALFLSTSEHLPTHLASAFEQVFTVIYISAATGSIIADLFVLILGWLFIIFAISLLNGKRNHRLLFGWLCIGHAPLAIYSLFTLIILLYTDILSYDGLSDISAIEQLAFEIAKMQDTESFIWLRYGRYLVYGITAVFAAEMVHRVCKLSRVKSGCVLAIYVFVNVIIQIYTN